ncbi:MAG: dUTP diphosphatase [Deltaproteobacteria bacterium]|nr:dUTP diphosphatase [Deltaproteobacteria bacterium]
MEKIQVSIEKLPGCDDIEFPRYMTECAAGMDVFAAVKEAEILQPGERKIIPTGIRIALPAGYEAQIRPRSGLAIRNGITLLNTPGTIDSDYRGEIGIIMINHGQEPFEVKRGDRIAQMTVHRVCRVLWHSTSFLQPTVRGDGGFGHTG